LGKGFQPEVMVIPAIPFQMWLKFRRNQQGLIGVMTLEVSVTIHLSSIAPSSFSYLRRLSNLRRLVVGWRVLLMILHPTSHLSVWNGRGLYLFMNSGFTRSPVAVIIL